VCAGEGIDGGEVLDLLTQLVNKSLVIFEERDGQARYRMLETIRQYATEKLLEAGQSDAIRDRHLSFFVRLAEEAAPKLVGKEVKAWLDRLERELDNMRIALDRSKDIARIQEGLRLATALEWFWYPRGYQAEGLEHLQALVGLLPPATHLLARARALIVIASIHWARGSYAEAFRTGEEALAIGNQLADGRVIADAYLRLGIVATARGDYAAALAFYEHSLLNYQTSDSKHETASVLFFRLFRGEALLRQGDYAAAQTFFLENIARMQELELKNYLAYVTRRLGQTLLHQADYPGARIRFQESLVANVEIGDVKAVAACLAAFAALALAQKELARAAQLFGASEAVSESIYTEMTPYDHDQYTRNVAALHTQSPAADFEAAWEAGRKLTLEKAVKLAME
jgi:tetratricopeptide (TPR) repeat protein